VDAIHPGAEEIAGDGVDNDCDPDTCVAGGFEDTPADWSLPAGYGDYSFFLAFGSSANCATRRPAWTLALTAGELADMVILSDPCADTEVGVDSWRVHDNTGTRFDGSRNLSLPTGYGVNTFDRPTAIANCAIRRPAWTLLDLDGDGLQDIVITRQPCDGSGGWTLHRATPTGFASGAAWSVPSGYGDSSFDVHFGSANCAVQRPAWMLRDLDGDGRVDLVITEEPCGEDGVGTTHWRWFRNTGSTFAAGANWSLPTGYGEGSFRSNHTPNCSIRRPAWRLLDLDADPGLDLVITRNPCDEGELGDSRWDVYPGTGRGFGAAVSWALPSGYGTSAFASALGGTANCSVQVPTWSLIRFEDELDLVVTRSPCTDDDVGTLHWLRFANEGGGFNASGRSWTLPSGFGHIAFQAPFGVANCGAGRPMFVTTQLGEHTSLIVTQTACRDQGVGSSRWWVFDPICDL
jgi:hypothetical protein